MSTIPASQIVSVTPNVLSAGGNALDTIGLILTTSTRAPLGQVLSFASPADVAAYFGTGTDEATAASKYFLGFDDSNVKPGSVLYAQYNTGAAHGYVKGGALGLTLTQLQALTPGALTVIFAGVTKTSSSIDLSGATSFSNAATLITAAFTSPGFAVTYDSVADAFVATSTATGAAETIVYPTGAFAPLINFTSATGAQLSQGALAAVPGTFMDGVVGSTQDFVSFMTIFDPDVSGNANKLLFSEWNNDQDNRFAYICWDTDVTPSESSSATGSLGYLIAQASISGTSLIGRDVNGVVDFTYAAFVCGSIASIDFNELNGRTDLCFRRQAGLVATVSNATSANNLTANGYNFYGAYATANDDFVWLYDGQVSGEFDWLDSYVNQIWLSNSFQLAGMELLGAMKSIPYDPAGYALIGQALMDPINQGLRFGAFRAGVTLSSAQTAEVNSAAGANIAPTLTAQGWYLQILDPGASVRAARGSPEITFWYMDGESVQKLDLTSILVQ